MTDRTTAATLAAIGAGVLLPTAAAAADLGTPYQRRSPEPEPYYAAPLAIERWTGFYFGGTLGYAGGTTGIAGDSGAFNFDTDGSMGTLFAGYNWQKGANFVFGVEAEYNWADADGSDRVVSPTLGLGPVVDRIDVDINRTAAIRGRVGYAVDRTLLYVTAGWAWIDHDGAVRLLIALYMNRVKN